MHHLKSTLALLIFPALIITSLSSCNDNNEYDATGDYYPLSDRTEQYQEYIAFTTADGFSDNPWDTATVSIGSTTTVDGKDYKTISHSWGFQRLIRKDGTKYFVREQVYAGGPFDDKEVLFLDTSLKSGSTWTEDQPNLARSVKYTIKEKNTTLKVFDRTFDNIIVVQEDYYRDGADAPLAAYRYYQKNVGEVYSYLPYPLSLIYADAGAVLLK